MLLSVPVYLQARGVGLRTVTVSSNGGIVVPLAIRRPLGLRAGEQLGVAVEGNKIILTPTHSRATRHSWRAWAGVLAGTNALEAHRKEHRAKARRLG